MTIKDVMNQSLLGLSDEEIIEVESTDEPVEEQPVNKGGRPTLDSYDSTKYLLRRTKTADRFLMDKIAKGDTNALRIFYQLTKRLDDKKDMTLNVRLSADEHFAIRREAQRRLSEGFKGANGDRVLLPECEILSPEVCVDTEQEHGEDGEVESLGFPTGTA